MKKTASVWLMLSAAIVTLGGETLIKDFAQAERKDFSVWAPAAYQYQTAWQDGVGTITVRETKEPKSGFQIGILVKGNFRKGVTYRVTGILKANLDCRLTAGLQTHAAPRFLTDVNGKACRRQITLRKDVPQEFSLELTPNEDVAAVCRLPGLHTEVLPIGSVIEISQVKLYRKE